MPYTPKDKLEERRRMALLEGMQAGVRLGEGPRTVQVGGRGAGRRHPEVVGVGTRHCRGILEEKGDEGDRENE